MTIPKEVESIIEKLKKNGYEAYIVGGCVRDLLRRAEPNDWDIATNARPEEIVKVFPKSFANNNFGTVTVLTDSRLPKLKEIEITPYRLDEKYSDKRHPDKIKWAKTIKQDLGRRDFTVNAIAMEIGPPISNSKDRSSKDKIQLRKIIDPFDGQKDLDNKIIRAVGNAEKRFSEDALRLMRAVRFVVVLGEGWQIEEGTFKAIQKNSELLKFISEERIRDELVKIIMSPNGARGVEILRRAGLLKHIIPELEQGFGLSQNKHHIYQIYQHNLLSLNYACQNGFSQEVRMAALFHDIGKPKTKRGQGPDSTFYNHEIVGAKMTLQIMRRLKFSKKEIEKVVKLVRYHLFYYNVGEVGESSVRRLLRNVGKENIEELLQVRYCDRIGSGVPKAEPYKLRHLRYLFEKVSNDPISVKMLKVNGNDVMKILDIEPGPKIGQILTCLLGEVLKDPRKNNRTFLGQEIVRLGQKMSGMEFFRTFKRTLADINRTEQKKDEMTKKKYWVS